LRLCWQNVADDDGISAAFYTADQSSFFIIIIIIIIVSSSSRSVLSASLKMPRANQLPVARMNTACAAWVLHCQTDG